MILGTHRRVSAAVESPVQSLRTGRVIYLSAGVCLVRCRRRVEFVGVATATVVSETGWVARIVRNEEPSRPASRCYEMYGSTVAGLVHLFRALGPAEHCKGAIRG